jgi:hypothetical protein
MFQRVMVCVDSSINSKHIFNYSLHNAPCSVFILQPPIDVETTPVQTKEIAHSTLGYFNRTQSPDDASIY